MTAEEDFARFMTGRYPALVRTAFLLTGDRDHAEDLAQAALLRTFLAWPRLYDPANAEAYTRTVMARLSVRWARRRWRGERASADVDRVSGDDATDFVDTADVVLRALALLPPAQRAVLVLRFYEQRSEADIAAILRCAPGTVKSRCARALSALRAAGIGADTPVPEEPRP
jgi:RNA polymerase sigma-70 factor (sigma-E family)